MPLAAALTSRAKAKIVLPTSLRARKGRGGRVRTKIVATIGPASNTRERLRELAQAGVSIFRLNFSHGGAADFVDIIGHIRAIEAELNLPLTIMQDLSGPKIRLGVVKEKTIQVSKGMRLLLGPTEQYTSELPYLPFDHEIILQSLDKGDRLVLADGGLQFVVEERRADGLVLLAAENSGIVTSRKGLALPGKATRVRALTDKDKRDLNDGLKLGVDAVAISYVQTADDVLEAKEIIAASGRNIPVVVKLERQGAVENLDAILDATDAVMVARGDLGVECPLPQLPALQKHIIAACNRLAKPVIVATQMLHTMIQNPRPTRAEVTDIANAIYYRTDALMLSGETAYGKYPVEAVQTMTRVAAQAEQDKLPDNDIRIPLDENSNDVTAFLAKQAVKATTKLKIRAIITDSYSGRTARNLAAFRGKYPVLAICYKEKTMRHLALSYGVEAIYMPELANGQEYYFAALRRLLNEGKLQPTDMVGYLSSGKAGTQTSFLEINVVEDALKHAGDSVLPNSNRYL